MAQLNFPDNPIDGQLYPNPCPTGVTQYSWDSGSGIWRIVGVATGVLPGQYGNSLTVGQFTVDVAGKLTQALNIPIQGATTSQPGVSQLTTSTDSISETTALSARGGKVLQDQIGNLNNCIVPDHVNVVAALNDLQNQTSQLQTDALIWCGYYNALEGDISYVSIVGQKLGYQIGQELPTPGPSNGGDFFIVTVAGNPYIAGDYNAPDANLEVGNWIVSETVRWSEVDTRGKVTAKDVSFIPTAPLTATNVQNAIYQVTQLFRTGIGGATISETKPSNPYPGQLWWDDDDGIFYIFYTDINSSQWVEIGGGGSQGVQGGSGSVYEIRTGVGLTGGPITTEGTISLEPAFVDAGTPANSTIGGVLPNKGFVYSNTTGLLDLKISGDPTGKDPYTAFSQEGANILNAKIDSLSGGNVLAGTFDAKNGVMVYATPAGVAKGFIAGDPLPAPSASIDNYYVIVTIGGTQTPNPGQTANPGDWYICQADEVPAIWFLIDYEGVGSQAVNVNVVPIPGIEQATNVQRALELIELQAQDRIEFAESTTDGLQITVSQPGLTSNDGTTLSLGLDYASVDDRGIVQLTNDLTGNSETLAITQFAANTLNAKVEALVGSNVLAGTYNSNTGTVSSVTPAGSKAGFVVGTQAPAAASVPDNYYLIVTVTGGYGPPGAVIPPAGVQSGDWFIVENEQGTAAWVTIDFENRVVSASQVNLTPIPGLSATNVQTGMNELTGRTNTAVQTVYSSNDGISIDTAPVNAGYGYNVGLTLNPATATDIGGVFVAPNLGIGLTASGGLSLLPPSGSVIGGVKAGQNVTIESDGTINAQGGGGGGGELQLIDSIASQFNGNTTNFVLKSGGNNLPADTATASLFIFVGGIEQTPGVSWNWSAATSTISFTTAPAAGLSFDGRVAVNLLNNGGGGGGSASDISVDPIPGIDTASNVQEALEAIELQVQDRIEFCNIVGGGITAAVSAPVRNSNDGTTLTLTTADAKVGVKGLATLTSDYTGNSESLAITQLAASQLNGKIDALTGANVLAGTYNSSTGKVASVTPAGSTYLTVGAQAPAASTLPDNYYLVVTVGGNQAPPGATIPPTGVQSGDWFVVEKESGKPAIWFTVDFENAAVAAVNVSLSAITGLTATNVQAGIQELETKAEKSFTDIKVTAADGLTVTNTAAGPAGRTATLSLSPATATDLGGVFVQPNQGIDLGANGSLNLTIATTSRLGGVKVGPGLSVAADGTISVAASSLTMKAINGIQDQFNGTTSAFVLNVTGSPIGDQANELTMFLEVGGVLQAPGLAYTYNPTTSQVTFSSPPPTGATFSGRVLLGVTL